MTSDLKRWTSSALSGNLALYSKSNTDYLRALAREQADPDRAKIADEAIKALTEYDTEDSGVQPAVRLCMAKLNLLKGDYKAARVLFDAILKTEKDITWSTKYDAKYFRAVCDLQDKSTLDTAKKDVADLRDWAAKNIKDPNPQVAAEAQKAAEAQIGFFEYRVYKTEGKLKNDPKASQQATTVLMNLQQARPDLRPVITKLLLDEIGDDTNPKVLDAAALRAVIGKGEGTARDIDRLEAKLKEAKAANDAATVKTIQASVDESKKKLPQAIACAKELLTRAATQPAIPKPDVEAAAFLLGLFNDMADKDLDGANAYMDYIEKFNDNQDLRNRAFTNAAVLVTDLNKATPNDPAIQKAYERFCDIGLQPPFSKNELAFDKARILLRRNAASGGASATAVQRQQMLGRVQEIISLLQRVPADDPRLLYARHMEMSAWNQKLFIAGASMPPAEKKAAIDKIQQLAALVDTQADAAIKATADVKQQQSIRSLRAGALLTAADLAVRQASTDPQMPQKALDMLQGFEDRIVDLPDAQKLRGEASETRFKSLVALKRTAEALDSLGSLVEKMKPDQGLGFATQLMDNMGEEFNKAKAANDIDRISDLAAQRARSAASSSSSSRKAPTPKSKNISTPTSSRTKK